jgi:hypothetical protein
MNPRLQAAAGTDRRSGDHQSTCGVRPRMRAVRTGLGWFFAALVAAVAALVAPAAAAQAPGQVLAAGAVPLTAEMVDRVTALFGEALGSPVPSPLRERLRAVYVEHWRNGRQEEIETVLTMVELSRTLQGLPAQARAQAMLDFRAALIAGLREAARADADARELLALHEQARRTQPSAARAPSAAAPSVGQAAPGALLPVPPAPARPLQAAAVQMHAAAPVSARRSINAPATGVSYTPPPGWTRQDNADATVFEARLTPEPRASHAARIVVFKPQPAPRGVAAQFEAEWQRLIVATVGDPARHTVAHYRNRLPGGVDAYFMGRFFPRPGQTQELYAVMYVLDLGERTQTLVATVIGGWEGVGYPAAVDGSAHHALSQTLFPLLDSIHVPGQRADGPLFSAADVRGAWSYNDGSYGGSFVNASTGALLGAAVRGASSTLVLRDDGSYDYTFAMYAVNPNAAADIAPQAEKHGGRYDFADDIIHWRPRQGGGSDPRRKVVGGGVRHTPQGPRRLMIVVGPSERTFRPPMWVPLGDRYDGVMHWYVEDAAGR